jgi:hypothetical protein
MYKHQAYLPEEDSSIPYAEISKPIETLGDLRQHCSPIGYVCGSRWNFLHLYIPWIAVLEDDLSLFDLYNPKSVIAQRFIVESLSEKIINDGEVSKGWHSHEYDNLGKWRQFGQENKKSNLNRILFN